MNYRGPPALRGMARGVSDFSIFAALRGIGDLEFFLLAGFHFHAKLVALKIEYRRIIGILTWPRYYDLNTGLHRYSTKIEYQAVGPPVFISHRKPATPVSISHII